ncbi:MULTISPECIES: hypothetical protein [unclassified Lysobacter]|uniref:hypothetical protein n=1 Tax=unclassified Lysobacter TaxID=2635362 RepID=UPI000712674E|nr:MULTISPECIES: hypothetical protein [unclassified Lysobacter]KRD75831.1 hypothetical protein ASE43_13435 [Lysobacter sp. Root983]
MTVSRNELTEQVHEFARQWLGHDLDEDERKQLAEFLTTLSANEAVLGGYTDQARRHAADIVDQGRQRVEAAMKTVLGAANAPPADAAAPAKGAAKAAPLTREEQAILRLLESSRTLGDLRPSQLKGAGEGETAAAQLAIAQIADRLAILIKAEVEACFERQYGPLTRQIEAVLEAGRAEAGARKSPSAASSA